MKPETNNPQTLKDAIAFGEYLTALNPEFDQTLQNFMRALPPEMLLDSEEFNALWCSHLNL